MSAELLPCPFCGETPDVTDRPSTDTATGHVWFISCCCKGYSANAHQHGDTKQAALAAWNRRPPHPAESSGRVALTDEQITEIIHRKHFSPTYSLTRSDEVVLNWYRQGIRDGEFAHNIPSAHPASADKELNHG